MPSYIHGETDPVEVARLEKQARFLTRWILDGVEAGPGARVLDLACGTGAMARRLLARLPDVHLIGSDLSRTQLKAARQQSPRLPLVSADAARLPFAAGTFDVVHWSWLLEHVQPAHAQKILSEVRRVVADTGCAWMTEVDNDSLAFWPRLPLVEECFRSLWRAQEQGGGDPIIGRKLQGLCALAGFTDVQVQPLTFHFHNGSPPGYFRAMLEEFAEILLSARESLPKELNARADQGAAQLTALDGTPGASFTYTCFRVRAAR